MERYQINVLCTDPETCREVRSTMMADYEIKDSDLEGFDHLGFKEFDSMLDAVDEAYRLQRESGGKIIDATVSYA